VRTTVTEAYLALHRERGIAHSTIDDNSKRSASIACGSPIGSCPPPAFHTILYITLADPLGGSWIAFTRFFRNQSRAGFSVVTFNAFRRANNATRPIILASISSLALENRPHDDGH
jgi:hypothetical protein